MTYGYIYVAQIALGANMNQAVKAIAEAEAYPGPSLIIGYAPCELHGVKGGMTNCQNEMKKAVEAGYWNLQPGQQGSGQEPVHSDLQGSRCREVPGSAGKRDPLQPPDPCLPGARKAAVRTQRAGRKRSLRASDSSGRAVQVIFLPCFGPERAAAAP
jgi:hypothetical protein